MLIFFGPIGKSLTGAFLRRTLVPHCVHEHFPLNFKNRHSHQNVDLQNYLQYFQT